MLNICEDKKRQSVSVLKVISNKMYILNYNRSVLSIMTLCEKEGYLALEMESTLHLFDKSRIG